MAIGQGHRANYVDDIFLGPDEKQPPKERSAIVDLLIKPIGKDGKILDSFPAGSPWLELWGNGISQDTADNDFAAIRTVLQFNVGKGDYGVSRSFLLDWPAKLEDLEKAKLNEKHGPALWSHVEPLSLFFMDAKRDIHDELHNGRIRYD